MYPFRDGIAVPGLKTYSSSKLVIYSELHKAFYQKFILALNGI